MAIYIDRQKPNSGLASFLAARGRHGDTELVHMTKPEVKRLMNTGLMTLNPRTGLPEMFLGDVFKGIKTYVKNLIKPKNLIPTLAGMVGGAYLGPLIGGAAPFLSRAGAAAIGKGLGVAAGSLPFRDLGESAQAGTTAAFMDYGTSVMGDMLRPGPDAYGLPRSSDAYDRYVGDALMERQKVGELDNQFASMDMESGGVGGDSYGILDTAPVYQYADLSDVNTKIAGLPPKPSPAFTKWSNNLTGRELGQKFRMAPEAVENRLVGRQQADPRQLRAFIEGKQRESAGPLEFGSLGPDEAARKALARQWAMKNNAILTEKMRRQVNDPWAGVKEQVSGADGLSSINIKELGSAIPLGEVLSDVATTQEALGITDMLSAQAEAEEEAKKELEKMGSRTYTHTRPGGVRYVVPQGKNLLPPIKFRRAEQGGLISLAHGGDMRRDFEGLVQGRGHGMQDNVIMDIKQKGGLLAVSPKEYVVPADVMSGLGNGNPDAGAEYMDEFISDFRKKKYGRDKQPPEMDGRSALQSLMA